MFWLLAFCAVFSHVVAVPNAHRGQRIVGGELTTIDRYPMQAALLFGLYPSNIFYQSCGGIILNTRSVMTGVFCVWYGQDPRYHRIRVGSTFANSGGVVHSTSQLIIHPNFNYWTQDSDIVIVRSSTIIAFNNFVQPAAIAGTNYNLLDNQPVWAIGWGLDSWLGAPSEQLRHVQLWTINQEICRSRYGAALTDNMLCAGVLDIGGRGQCSQDTGGPLLHNGVVVGLYSFSYGCGDPYHPGVNTRISRFTTWIQANA